MKRAALFALLAGCHATTSLEPPPTPPNARSMLLLALADGYRHAFAIDIPDDGSPPAFPTFTRPSEVDLYAISFRCPLDVLGMGRGRQIFLEEPAPRLELPPPEAVVASHDGREQTAWEPIDLSQIEDTLRLIQLPPNNLCRLYGVNLMPLKMSFLVSTSTPTALIPRSNGKVIVANSDHTFFEVDADRNVRPLPALTGAPNRSGFERADGTVVLVGPDGVIVHGDPERGVQILQTETPTVSELMLVDGSRTGPIELFRTSSFGGPFERWTEETGWERLTEGGAGFDSGAYSVAWLEPNEAIATGVVQGTNSVFRYKNGALTEEIVPGIQRPTAVANIPGIGLVLGTESGAILRYVDERFQLEQGSDIDSQVRAIVPIEGGFFYGRTRWASWDPVAGYCEQEPISADGTRVAPFGDQRGFLAIGDLYPDVFRRRSFLFTLDRADVEHPCLGK